MPLSGRELGVLMRSALPIEPENAHVAFASVDEEDRRGSAKVARAVAIHRRQPKRRQRFDWRLRDRMIRKADAKGSSLRFVDEHEAIGAVRFEPINREPFGFDLPAEEPGQTPSDVFMVEGGLTVARAGVGHEDRPVIEGGLFAKEEAMLIEPSGADVLIEDESANVVRREDSRIISGVGVLRIEP